jgi:choline dehydrogenase-like flavoprotein
LRELQCDILIIGSGAAGGVLASTLAESGNKKIILVEKGGYYNKDFFNQHELDMNVLYAERGARSTNDDAMPVRGGECVGGGTTVNFALCFDPVPQVWEKWKNTYHLQGFSFDESASDYNMAGLNLPNCTREIRKRINIHKPADDEINDNNRILEKGCKKLGIACDRFELNMQDCLGCGFCGEGCSYDRKQGTMITYIADAIQNGVQLIHHCHINSIEFQKRGNNLQAVAAEGIIHPTSPGSQPNSVSPGALRIKAGLVIVSSGSIETPSLLQRSGHPDPHNILGKGLVLHPSLPIVGLFEQELTNYRGLSGSIYSHHFYDSHGFYVECLFGHPVYGSLVLPSIGAEHFELMLKFSRLAGFGVMLIDRVDLNNRVEWSKPQGKSLIHYHLSEGDKERLRFAAQKGIEIMFAGGASEVLLPSEEPVGSLATPRFKKPHEAAYCSDLQFNAHQTTITSAHCQATVKMGEDKSRSMINSRCESHFVKNLIVCDSSSFPESCGANPMLSIMSLARYQGKRIAGEMGRYEN